MKKAVISLLFGLVILFLFIGLNHVEISTCDMSSAKLNDKQVLSSKSLTSSGKNIVNYSCEINSLIEQTVKIGIGVNTNLLSVKINGINIDVDAVKKQYEKMKVREWQHDWRRGYTFILPLGKGNNNLQVITDSNASESDIEIGQGLDYFEYLILFLFSIAPIIFGIYILFFDRFIRVLKYFHDSDSLWYKLPIIILTLGIILRLMFLIFMPLSSYQHDYFGHIEAIRYYSEYMFTVPQPDKGLEFPQQPLYYWMSSTIYTIATGMGNSEHFAFQLIRSMSVVFSIAWLIVGLKLIQLYTNNRLLINLFVTFLSFTPSFIFMSTIVGNDSLNTLLGMISLYAVSAYFTTNNIRFFYVAFIAILLAMLTKISSALYAIFVVVVLLVMYFQTKTEQVAYKKLILKFSTAVLFIFGLSLIKAYVPATGEFLFINSALFENQIIPALNFGYFISFNFIELINAGQAYVFGIDEIRFSLPTYLYGTMFAGEYDYSKYFEAGTLFQFYSQLMYLFGLIYVVGIGAYIFFYKKAPILYKLLIVPVVINFILIIKFLLEFWDVSNSDFRFFSPTFAVLGLMVVLGLGELLKRYPALKKMIVTLVVLLAAVEISWMIKLILITP